MDINIKFNFYGVSVDVTTDSQDLKERLSLDFSYFIAKESAISPDVRIKASLKEAPGTFPVIERATFLSKKVRFLDHKGFRYCNYHNSAWSIFSLRDGSGEIFSLDIHALHEMSYLFILSRVGKLLDLKGLHRLHCGSILFKEKLFLFCFPSRGGKTTLISHLLQEPSTAFVSDDSPLIDRKGRVYPFPVRFGFEKDSKIPGPWSNLHFYELERFRFGKKYLLSLSTIEDLKIGGDYKDSFLFYGERGTQFHLSQASALPLLGHIFREGVIGIGLPILIEYFWEPGFKDLIRKTKIFFSRLVAFFHLFMKSRQRKITLSDNPKGNAKKVLESYSAEGAREA